MVVLAVRRLVAAGRPLGHPPAVRPAGLPTLFGVCVYSFMCHHSLPSLITPIADKSRITGQSAAFYSLRVKKAGVCVCRAELGAIHTAT